MTSSLKLKRSFDRKVTNLANQSGSKALIANTFGLPSGKDYSCPEQTSVCERICYAGKLEKIYPSVRNNLLHNWTLLTNTDRDGQYLLIKEMIDEFEEECNKRGAAKEFRIHWDGDFFTSDYTSAWASVVGASKDISFWVYTRVPDAARTLAGISNLAVYFSADMDNKHHVPELMGHGVKIAFLAETFAEGKDNVKKLRGVPGAACPENSKQIPLITTSGGACHTCGLCITGKADIRFSVSKR